MCVCTRVSVHTNGVAYPSENKGPLDLVPTISPERGGGGPFNHHLSGRREEKPNGPANRASQRVGDGQRTWVAFWCLGPWKVSEH